MSRDKLLIRGLRLFGRHGVLAEEKVLGQPFLVDVDVHADLSVPARSDNFKDTLDYVRVVNIVRDTIQGPSRDLVEYLAGDIASKVLKQLPTAQSVRVCVTKPHVALPHTLSNIGIELCRTREEMEQNKDSW